MPRTGRPKIELVLTDDEREQLTRWARRAKSSQALALALRSRIVLGCGEGLDNKSVAGRVGCSPNTVGRWRARFRQDRLDGLVDEPRPGRPPTAPSSPASTADTQGWATPGPAAARRFTELTPVRNAGNGRLRRCAGHTTWRDVLISSCISHRPPPPLTHTVPQRRSEVPNAPANRRRGRLGFS